MATNDPVVGADGGENNIQVFIRIRPPAPEDPAYSQVVEVDQSGHQLILKQTPTPKTFSFDHVADLNVSQESVFSRLGKKVVENCVAGYNGTIFAYGQTGSGKTFTMLGPSDCDNFQSDYRGVIPRTFECLFSLVNRQKELHGENKEFLCKCSFLEIYNEQIFDLLEPSQVSLQLRESFKTGVYVSGLTEKVVTDASEAYEILSNSWMNRRVGATSMNRESSRSHAVFSLQIESKKKNGAMENIKTSSLNLVDLAGSERQRDTGASGIRLKEAGKINKSLSNLGNCIMALVSESRDGKKRFVPYRDSKLTFLLRDSLGGNSKTSLIACIHSGHKCIGETLSTLQFAKRAKLIKNKAVMNENAHGNVKELQAEIRQLKEQLRNYKSGEVPCEVSEAVPDKSAMEMKKMFIQAMYLQQKIEAEKYDLIETLASFKDICEKKDKVLLSSKMIIKFRENNIKMLESKLKGTDISDSRITDLLQEVDILRKQLENNTEAKKYMVEMKQLKSALKALKSESATLSHINEDREIVTKLETKFKTLLAEQEDQNTENFVTPQKTETISTATVEKLRSQVSDLESELEEVKQKVLDSQQTAEKKELLLQSELESHKNQVKELETVISANMTKNKLETAALKEQHLQAVKLITTPKKEKYHLRNRTVLTNSDTPDLNSTIPFEEGLEDGIMEEMAPEFVLEQANESLISEIKKLQELNSCLEIKVSNYEANSLKLSMQKTTTESQLAQLEELLEKERMAKSSMREELSKAESRMKEALLNKDASSSEIKDLRMVLAAADKELKENKQKVLELETTKRENIDSLETKLAEVDLILQKLLKDYEKVLEEKAQLEMILETEAETREFQEGMIATLEAKIEEKISIVKHLEHHLQNAEQTLLEEKDLKESLINQLNSEGMEKDKEVIHHLEQNKMLQSEFESMKNMLEASEVSAITLRKAIAERDEKMTTLEKSLKHAEEKLSQQYMELQETANAMNELRQEKIGFEDKLEYFTKTEQETNIIVEQLKQELEEKDKQGKMECSKQQFEMDMLNEDMKSLQKDLDEMRRECEGLQENLARSQEQESACQTEIEKLKESLRSKEEATVALSSSKEMELSSLMTQLEELQVLRLQRNKEIVHLKERLHETDSNTEVLKAELCNVKLEKEEAENCFERVKEEKSMLHTKLMSTEEKLTNAESQVTHHIVQMQELKSRIQNYYFDCEELRRENGELMKTETRLKELAERDNQENIALRSELQAFKSGVKQIQMLYADTMSPDTCGIEEIVKNIKTTKEQAQKLADENCDLVSHHNLKQRIRYHETLKNENIQLKKDLAVQENLNKQLQLQLEKKKLGHQRSVSTLKENTLPDPDVRNFLSGDFTSRK